ncbi:MAG: dienelactone hydrolase family protein [Vicinamibacterales bacterium]
MEPHGGQPIVTAGVALGESPTVMIMVHGRGAAPRNILDLVPRLNRQGFTYLAPAAANNTWYPYSFMADTAKNEPGLSSALDVLDRLVKDVVARGVRKDHIVLLGFSQGACLTSEFAVRHADRYGGVILFTGGLVGPPGTTWSNPGSFAGTPVFLGSSDPDPHVPKDRVDESAAVFTRMGAAVTERIYQGMGHTINDEEIVYAQAVMDGVP